MPLAPSPSLSRRRFHRAGGGLLAAAAMVGSTGMLSASRAAAALPDSPRFRLSGAGGNPFWRRSLHANWVLQSFAYDNERQHIYFAQYDSTNTDPGRIGDLWVTRTDITGNQSGAMALRGFGHGVGIGVEPYRGEVHLWTEWRTGPSGYGTRIGRFRFVNGATLTADDPSIEDRTPSVGGPMIEPQPAIDPWTNRLLVRYKVAPDRPRIVVFDLDDARAGRLGSEHRLAERALPSRGAWGGEHPFQGFAACGRYAYLIEGPVGGPACLTALDLNGAGESTVVDRFVTDAGQSLPGREPQGMAVWIAAGRPRLAFGFHSNSRDVRQATVFYKSDFV
ncbi:phage baseplate protein [Streptomyces mayteni]